jgi:hypothetical protein
MRTGREVSLRASFGVSDWIIDQLEAVDRGSFRRSERGDSVRRALPSAEVVPSGVSVGREIATH